MTKEKKEMKNCKYYSQVMVYQLGMKMDMCAQLGKIKIKPTSPIICQQCAYFIKKKKKNLDYFNHKLTF